MVLFPALFRAVSSYLSLFHFCVLLLLSYPLPPLSRRKWPLKAPLSWSRRLCFVYLRTGVGRSSLTKILSERTYLMLSEQASLMCFVVGRGPAMRGRTFFRLRPLNGTHWLHWRCRRPSYYLSLLFCWRKLYSNKSRFAWLGPLFRHLYLRVKLEQCILQNCV